MGTGLMYYTADLNPVQQREIREWMDHFREPIGRFAGLPIIIVDCLGEFITRRKVWRRRGIGREPKVRVRVVGREPAVYEIGGHIYMNREAQAALGWNPNTFMSQDTVYG